MNLNVMKCYKTFFSKAGIINNYAFYLISSFLIMLIMMH